MYICITNNENYKKIKDMSKLELVFTKAERETAWGELLIKSGFERDQFDNKYRKRIVLWSRDGVDYTAKTATNKDGDLVITLTEYN